MNPDAIEVAGLRRLYLALANHARSARVDIARLGDTLTRHLPEAVITDELVVELQSIDRVGQSIEDGIRMLECLAERRHLSDPEGNGSFEDVVGAANLRATRERMSHYLNNGRSLAEDAAESDSPAIESQKFSKSRAMIDPGSIDFF